MKLLYSVHPELREILSLVVAIPANNLDAPSALRFGNILYCLWQYVSLYRIADLSQPVLEQRELAAVNEWLRDVSVSMRRFYGNSNGSVRLSLTTDAQTQMNAILSRDPTIAFDFDITNACIRMMAGVSLA